MKVQGAALAAPVVLETLRDPQILEKVRNGDNLRDAIQRYVPEGNKLRLYINGTLDCQRSNCGVPRAAAAAAAAAAAPFALALAFLGA